MSQNLKHADTVIMTHIPKRQLACIGDGFASGIETV